MSLPVTRTFSGPTTGAITNVDEANWAYNRSTATNFAVAIDGNGSYCQSADQTSDTMMHWTGDTFGTNHYSEVVLNVISTNGAGVGRGYGPACRLDTSSTHKTGYRMVCDSHGWEFGRCDNPAFTSLATGTDTFVQGSVVRMSVSVSGANDSVSLTLGGVHLGASPYTVTSPLTGGAPGVAHSSTTSTGGGQGIDTWTGGNVAATAAQLIPAYTQTGGTWSQVYV